MCNYVKASKYVYLLTNKQIGKELISNNEEELVIRNCKIKRQQAHSLMLCI